MIPLVLGGLGAVGGGLGGAALAGRYMPELKKQAMTAAAKGQRKVVNALDRAASYVPGTNMEGAGLGGLGLLARDVQGGLRGAAQNIAMMPLNAVGNIAQAAPIAAGTVGGGIAFNQAGQALFPQQEAVDPESYGSSNSMGARYKPPTMQYV
jgi:hypothetical protein